MAAAHQKYGSNTSAALQQYGSSTAAVNRTGLGIVTLKNVTILSDLTAVHLRPHGWRKEREGWGY